MANQDLLGGRRQEMEFVYRSHAKKLRRILRVNIGRATCQSTGEKRDNASPPSADEIEDLIHEVFARLLAPDSAVQLARDRDPVPYLVRMARSLYVDAWRRRRNTTPSSSQGAENAFLFEDAERWGQHLLAVEIIATYASRLSPELAVLYEARFARGLSQRDAAAWLGVSRRQVRTLEQRLLEGAQREVGRLFSEPCPRLQTGHENSMKIVQG
jgi:RNA polymerase sigma factor (sigma-70 family)